MREIYITGSKGLVASRFVELYKGKYDLLTPEINELDITDPEALREYFKKINLKIIVNCAAFTNVGKAQAEKGDANGLCYRVNVRGVENLVQLAQEKNARLIQISTDMVHSGSKKRPGPYREEDLAEIDPNKLTWYGYTKAEAERLTLEKYKERSTILRLIYPVRARFDAKPDYFRWPLSLFDRGELYPLFNDQIISITFIDEACRALEKIIDRGLVGVFHAGSHDRTTPFDIISYLIEKARGVRNVVVSRSIDGFGDPVRYPEYGGLRVEISEGIFGKRYSTSREIVDKLIAQGLGK